MTTSSPDRFGLLIRAVGVLWLGMLLAALVYVWN